MINWINCFDWRYTFKISVPEHTDQSSHSNCHLMSQVVLCCIMHSKVCKTEIFFNCLILFLELFLLIMCWWIFFYIIVWANDAVVWSLILYVCFPFRAQIKTMHIVQHVARVWMTALDIMATLILNYQYFMLVIFVQLSQCCKQYVRYAK